MRPIKIILLINGIALGQAKMTTLLIKSLVKGHKMKFIMNIII